MYWPALAVGYAAQLVAAHFPNKQILDPQSEDPPMPQPAALWTSPLNVLWNDSVFLVASITVY